MATLFLICGLPGSGKTTLAKQLERTHSALRLCPDEWISAILADVSDTIEMDRLRTPVETVHWEVAKRALTLGINVILENGFWSREERDSYRAQADSLGAYVKLIYLNVDRDELWARLKKRNENLPQGSFAVREDQLDLWLGWFQPPTTDEFE